MYACIWPRECVCVCVSVSIARMEQGNGSNVFEYLHKSVGSFDIVIVWKNCAGCLCARLYACVRAMLCCAYLCDENKTCIIYLCEATAMDGWMDASLTG